jgi:hypothetical protein
MTPDLPSLSDNERAQVLGSLKEQLAAAEALAQRLLDAIKARLTDLEKLLAEVSGHWHAEDGFYRFYHQSLKVYGLQSDTERIVAELRALLPERDLNKWFVQIIAEGTGKTFDSEHNRRWLTETRPILEAYFHARAMLEYAVKYAGELPSAPRTLPSGWAAVLYLFDLR